MQVAEPWNPPETWADLSTDTCNVILTAIDAGLPGGNHYTDAARASDREAWRVVQRHAPAKSEKQCREVIKTWVKNGVLVAFDYDNPTSRKPVRGLRLDTSKRPS